MGRPRSKTLIEQMGFNDPDLTSPLHDDLVLWASAHVNSYIAELIKPDPKRPDKLWARIERACEEAIQRSLREIEKHEKDIAKGGGEGWLREQIEREQAFLTSVQAYVRGRLTIPENKNDIGIEELIFEYPVKTERDFIVGFVDMWVEVNAVSLEIQGGRWYNAGTTLSIERHGGFPSFNWERNDKRFGFEIKPKIPSLGELLRQLRTYETHAHANRWIVVSPDTRYREVIEGQGFGFWEIPS